MTDDNPRVALGTAEPVARRRPSGRLRRWLVWTGSAVSLAAASGAVAGKVYLDRVESRALRLAQTGSSLNTFLKNYIDSLKARDIPALLALYDQHAAGQRVGPWEEQLLSE